MDVVALDELTVAYCKPNPTLTFDTFLAAAAKQHVFDGLRAEAPAEFLRGLRPGPQGDLLAAAALRILAANREAIETSELKTQLADWLDAHYHGPFSAFYQRPKKRNAFEILNAFGPVAPALEEKISSAVAALKTLDGVENLRQKLLQLTNAAAGRVLVKPFLPAEALGDTLAAVFAAAIDLRAAETPNEVAIQMRRLESQTDEITGLVDATPTHYGRRLLLPAVESVHLAAQRKLDLHGPPAALDALASDRPLPLLEVGVTCTVGIAVTNEGDARAQDVVLTVTPADESTDVVDGPLSLGEMNAHSKQQTAVSISVLTASASATLAAELRWTNPDHSVGLKVCTLTLRAHEVHIDWPELVGLTPFRTYPVEESDQLVGRREQLRQLRSALREDQMTSLYVTGQRRVGKTSLVRVFTKELKTDPRVCVATVELGEARGAGGSSTIGALGQKLATRIVAAAGLREEVQIPEFTDSLAPLTDVIDEIREWDAGLRFIFVIDEFDEIPQETYRRDGPGDALFLPMRSLAQKPYVSWLLVGGERLPYIRDEQSGRLNTFDALSLDYLPLYDDGGAESGKDFADLVRRPFPSGFQVDEAAVRALYDQSAGNPHFAKEVCGALFRQSVARRDALISSEQVLEAVNVAARERDVELFAHFWEDGIFELNDEKRQVEIDRRNYLAGVASVLRSAKDLTDDRIRAEAKARGLDDKTITRIGSEYVRRGIIEDLDTRRQIHVPLFEKWLEREGIYKLPPRGISAQIADDLAVTREAAQVTSGEVKRLVTSWGGFTFRGERISRDQVDAWLEQFETPQDRRTAFRLLERLQLFNEAQIVEGMRRLHRHVAQAGQVQLKQGQRRMSNVLVSAVGGSGSSGEAFAYKYRQANNLSGNNVVPANRLIERLAANHDLSTVVLIDDFIGSGGTAIKALKPLVARLSELKARTEVQWFVFAVSGVPTGANKAAASKEARQLGLRVELAFPVLDADLPLGPNSTVFKSDERGDAERVLRKYGTSLHGQPLGFGGYCAPVVFPDNCPNNAAPILWSDAEGWRPLFMRTRR